ncbi:cystatin family protein [Streptomyces atroolivaceus]|uniref:cystatin family protein n=1 Tax=Streptomyces atroolivaceus TaxID=66869 RepID=UPI0036346C95
MRTLFRAFTAVTAVLALSMAGATTAASQVDSWTKVDPTSKEVRKVADFSASEIPDLRNRPYFYKVISILKAGTQVDAGLNYRIRFILAPTTCFKGEEGSRQCPVDAKQPAQKCTTITWVREWVRDTPEYMRLTSYSCKSTSIKALDVRR